MSIYKSYTYMKGKSINESCAHTEDMHIYKRHTHIQKMCISRDCHIRILHKLCIDFLYARLMYICATFVYVHLQKFHIYGS